MRSRLTTAALMALIAGGTVALSCGLLAARAGAATDGSYQDVYYVHSCLNGPNAAPIFSPSHFGFVQTSNSCLSLGGLEINARGGALNGNTGQWAAQTPAAWMRIIGVNASGLADCNLHKDGYVASYFYGDLGVNYAQPQITVNCHGGSGNSNAGYLNQKIQSARYFGWHASCNQAGGCPHSGAGGTVFLLYGIDLEVQDTSGPRLNAVGANNLYYQTGWVRGTWSTDLAASDPSGVCSLQTAINGTAINTYIDWLPDTSTWSQCAGNTLPSSVDTTRYANGAGAISLWDYSSNAAGAASIATRSVNVDNASVSVSLAGPANASSTAGTQYVTVTATAGPSGVAGIYCSVDGSAAQLYAGAAARVPVSGIGSHQVSCYARNNAIDSSGRPGMSGRAGFGVSIRQPTVAGISFGKIKDPLRCKRVAVEVRGRVRVVKRHGKKVKVRGRARTKEVLRCHARTVRRTVTVVVHRHGRTIKTKRVERIVLLPHRVNVPKLRVAHGKGATVSGVLLLTDGTALAGRRVSVLAAPDNGLGQFGLVTSATTAANGSWSARVPAGPSRLIEAAYGGDGTTEPVTSSTVKLTVPARIALSIVPRVLPWAGAITVRGHLVGGYVPRDGVALRLLVRYPGSRLPSPLLALRTNAKGSFVIRWSYNAGRGTATYPFSIATTATESDYPFVAAESRRLRVTFGRQTLACRRSAKLCL